MQNISKITEILNSINQLNNELEKETGFKVGQHVFTNYGVLVEIKSIFVEEDEIFAIVESGSTNIRIKLKNVKQLINTNANNI